MYVYDNPEFQCDKRVAILALYLSSPCFLVLWSGEEILRSCDDSRWAFYRVGLGRLVRW